MSFIKTLKNNYVIKQVEKQKLPEFSESEIKRYSKSVQVNRIVLNNTP